MNTKVKVFCGTAYEVETMANNYAIENNLYIISTSISSKEYGGCVMSVVYGRNTTHEH